jgi:pseudaminic acid biosynthesis-associated methylase
MIWTGDFGNEYTKRNKDPPDRLSFWRKILNKCRPEVVLEPGANRGFNLKAISHIDPAVRLWATDVNLLALEVLREGLPWVNAVEADVRDLPFRDGLFDLVFTVGVLIHVKPEDVPKSIQEMVRVSRRYLLLCEYANNDILGVVYRGLHGALWKAPFGQIAEQSAALQPLDSGFLTKDEGFDRVTWWLYEKSGDSTGAARQSETSSEGSRGHRGYSSRNEGTR